MSDPQGHSFGHAPSPPPALTDANFCSHTDYLYAIDLFNHGFYWEAHEAWEGLWHAAGRRGATADFLKGLIKLAAAGVKAKEGRIRGVIRHAQRAAELFESAQAGLKGNPDIFLGLRLNDLLSAATKISTEANTLTTEGQPQAGLRLPLRLRLVGAD